MDSNSGFGFLNYGVLCTYLAIMFAIGLRLAGKQKTTEDYFLAGRKIPWLVVGMSMFASLTSASSYMGVPGTAYMENIALIVVGITSICVAPILIVLFYPFYRRLNVTTAYEYINRRYGEMARFFTSGFFILARLGWLGVVIYSPALALSVTTHINLTLAIILMGILATTYTALGGLSAVLWTDLLQFIVLVGGALWVSASLIDNVPGGFSAIISVAQESGHLHFLNWEMSLYQMSALSVALSFFFQLMQDYGTDQVTVQRLMAVNNFRGMAKAIVLNSFFDFVIVGLLLFAGLGLFAFYSFYPTCLEDGITGDKILPYYIINALPVGVSGLVITGIFAAAMSSMDSGINSLATVIVNDFFRPLRSRISSEKAEIRLARILTFVLGFFAVCVAFYVSSIEQILKASSTFLSLFGGPILALFLLGILTRRGGFLGWCFSTLVAIGGTLWLQHVVGAHWTYYFPFCFGVSFLLGYFASLVLGTRRAAPEFTIWGGGLMESINEVLETRREEAPR